MATTLMELLSPALAASRTFSHCIYEILMQQLRPTEADTEAGRLEPGQGANLSGEPGLKSTLMALSGLGSQTPRYPAAHK